MWGVDFAHIGFRASNPRGVRLKAFPFDTVLVGGDRFKPTRGSAESMASRSPVARSGGFKPTRGSAESFINALRKGQGGSFKPTRGSAERGSTTSASRDSDSLQTHEGFG